MLVAALAACGRGPSAPGSVRLVGGIPGGPGTPAIRLTFVPEHGSTADLHGQVLHVQPDEYRVAVYLLVEGAWWTKPYFASPTTKITVNGSWTCDVTTGGIDQLATEMAARAHAKNLVRWPDDDPA